MVPKGWGVVATLDNNSFRLAVLDDRLLLTPRMQLDL